MSYAYASVQQLSKMLKNLDQWLEKSVEYAKQRGFDPDVLLQARLAPDMLALTNQIQIACDGAKFLAARLSGKEAPKHPDTETTMEQLRARIRSVQEYLSNFKTGDFTQSEERVVPLPFLPVQGKGLAGRDFLTEMNLPNTYFHLCMAYAILRHNGVVLGKPDYIGSLNLVDA